jgi:hypothetical protein
MAPSTTPQVGDLVSHEGYWGDCEDAFRVVGFRKTFNDRDEVVQLCIFENSKFKVTCLASELVWLDEDSAWMLPGRLLSRRQRAMWMDVTGVRTLPPAEKHVSARKALLAMRDPDEVRANRNEG